MGQKMLGEKVLVFKDGKVIGIYRNMIQVSLISKMSISSVSRLLQNGKVSKHGYSFDHEIMK